MLFRDRDRRFFAAVLFPCALGLGAGCSDTDDDSGDGDAQVQDTGGDTGGLDTGNPDVTEEVGLDAQTEPDEDFSGPLPPYGYVMIVDRTPRSVIAEEGTAGADVYGVSWVLPDDGQTVYASLMRGCEFGDGDNSAAQDCEQITLTPRGACDPSAAEPDFVSLGGEGGYVIAYFGDRRDFLEGHQIIVHECDQTVWPEGDADLIDVYLGVSDNPNDPRWVPCVMEAEGTVTCDIVDLPRVFPR